ncbi:MAG TPA: hypothetical protein DDY45_10605, partial [Verrucomicrobiales bacterium]|nr:hypothetical protein [Verrucomicrobiales bacterium]
MADFFHFRDKAFLKNVYFLPMKTFLLGFSLLVTPLFAAPPEGSTSLFNGKNFNGWGGAATENPA